LANQRLILAGDAGGLIDPFLGEGIYHAVVSGEIAARWVLESINSQAPDHSRYARLIDDAIGKELCFASRLATVIYRFPGLMYRLTRGKPEVLVTFGSCLTDEHGYRSFAKQIGYPYKLLFMGLDKV